MRVLAALSGGVDSAVAAARALEAGHDVVGVHMALAPGGDHDRDGARGCWSARDAADARRTAGVLGIPLEVWDLAERFEQTVVADFLAGYAAGRTPNPCVRCNEHIKFAALLDRAVGSGFDAVCTGHYARLRPGPDGAPELLRARNLAKDQSYVLAVAGPERLRRAYFPLGEVAAKQEVRAEAAARGLGVAAKPDSYDVCFVADGDTRAFLRDRLGSRPGEIRDVSGAVVGHHEGAYAFTVGQRRGLHLGRPAPDGRPRYVLAVQPATNTVVVGPAGALDVTALRGADAVWFERPTGWRDCLVQVRAHARPVSGEVSAGAGPPGGLAVRLAEPLRGVAQGQSVVLYDGERVIGQATVESAWAGAHPTP